jgi:hypothetical protein
MPHTEVEQLMTTLGNGLLAVIEGASHAFPFDDSEALHAAIREFDGNRSVLCDF